jgi:hypothetical protein
MIIVLSQKIDTESAYKDDLFNVYHYPSRYRNQIKEGDTFLYYQGNRYEKAQRYYFGTGIIGKIIKNDEDNYYARLINCKSFEAKPSIYLPDGGYIESLDYDEIRQRENPPWQSSIRPITEKAYRYVLSHAGKLLPAGKNEEISRLREQLKGAVRNYYLKDSEEAIVEVK